MALLVLVPFLMPRVILNSRIRIAVYRSGLGLALDCNIIIIIIIYLVSIREKSIYKVDIAKKLVKIDSCIESKNTKEARCLSWSYLQRDSRLNCIHIGTRRPISLFVTGLIPFNIRYSIVSNEYREKPYSLSFILLQGKYSKFIQYCFEEARNPSSSSSQFHHQLFQLSCHLI